MQEYTETVSPFYDISILNYCLKIPVKWRLNHRIYKKWILAKYPKVADYIWESTQSKLTEHHVKILGKEVPVKKLPKKVLYKLKLLKAPSETSFHMNPLSYWYKTNPEIKKFQDNYFEENIFRLDDYNQLKEDSIDLYETGNAIEKNQVLTLLSSLKLFSLTSSAQE